MAAYVVAVVSCWVRRDRLDRLRRGEACGDTWVVTAVAVEVVLISFSARIVTDTPLPLVCLYFFVYMHKQKTECASTSYHVMCYLNWM